MEFNKPESIDVFVKQGIFTEQEVRARTQIRLENYVKVLNIEVSTMIDMARQEIYPAVADYITELCSTVAAKKAVCADIPCRAETDLIQRLATLNDAMMQAVKDLEACKRAYSKMPPEKAALYVAHETIPVMNRVRAAADEMETLTAKEYWPMPDYEDILFSVK